MKYKKIPKEYFVTILDRLTRLEPAYIRYKRVFDDVINKFFVSDRLKNLTLSDEIKFVEEIFYFSLEDESYDDMGNSFSINKVLTNLEEKYFTFNELSYQYLSARLDLSKMINQIKYDKKLPKNVQWLTQINHPNCDILKEREEKSLLYPIEKIILCEGETENTLLEPIFKLFNIDFDKLGYLIIPAGGKNQVAKKFYKMIEYIKLPFFILLYLDFCKY